MGMDVDNAGCDPLALGVDDLCTRRDLDVLADRNDLAAVHNYGAAVDLFAGRGQDMTTYQSRKLRGQGPVGAGKGRRSGLRIRSFGQDDGDLSPIGDLGLYARFVRGSDRRNGFAGGGDRHDRDAGAQESRCGDAKGQSDQLGCVHRESSCSF